MHYAQKDNGLYILNRTEIEEIATKKLKEFAPINLERPLPLNTTDFLVDKLGLIVKNKYIGDFDSGILGLTVFGDIVPIPSYDERFNRVILEETFGTVLISPRLIGRENLPRRRYTEMHEASHFILHQPYFECCDSATAARIESANQFVVCKKIERTGKEQKLSDSDWMEYQADSLAAAMLMPREPFIEYARSIFRKYDVRGNYITRSTPTNTKRANMITHEIAEKFMVSFQAAQIRMKHLGLIRETTLF